MRRDLVYVTGRHRARQKRIDRGLGAHVGIGGAQETMRRVMGQVDAAEFPNELVDIKVVAQMPQVNRAANQLEQAPPLCGARSSPKSSDSRQTASKPPSRRMLPARNCSWIANGHAYTSPIGSIRHTTRPAPHIPSPGRP